MAAKLIEGGLFFDGTGSAGRRADVLVEAGRVRAIGEGLGAPPGAERVDASGAWVMPGFIDLHTHYDAEIEIAPGLGESLRHGVTTVMLGSCGLSLAVGELDDLADMFCRVEGIPRDGVVKILEERLDWSSPAEYLDHLGGLSLGPNVAAMLGHSTIRAHVMGLGRSLEAGERPRADELARMEAMVDEAISAGFLGLSINTLPWDKMGGSRYRSRPTPSVFASWREYARLADVARRRGALFQGVPNLSNGLNILLFGLVSAGLGRRPLKTMVLSLMDSKALPGVHRAVGRTADFFNGRLRADVRFQALPVPFDLYVDGLDVPVLEEIGAGTAALHVEDPGARARLLRDPAYRKRFRREWTSYLGGRAYHRDLSEATILSAPDPSLAGKSFADVARERGRDAIDAFLDLQAEHGDALRWHTVAANDRAAELEWIVSHPHALIGFSDAGAHLRNMGHYNFPLRMLGQVHEGARRGRPFMSLERAVHRLTGELADYLGVEAGRLTPGSRADVVVVDPAHLGERLAAVHEAPMPGFPGLRRLVRRSGPAVRHVLVRGEAVVADGEPLWGDAPGPGTGEVLRFADRAPAPRSTSPEAAPAERAHAAAR